MTLNDYSIPDMINVLTKVIDNRGYCVCKVSSLGKLTNELFVDLFESHFVNPAYLCSDTNSVYENYCNIKNIPLYERPSNYLSIIEKNGYMIPDIGDPIKTEETAKNNQTVFEKLYNEQLIDKITNRGYMNFEDFQKLKKQNSLPLGRVNELHNEIKKFIYSGMTNVSTKYLQNYIVFLLILIIEKLIMALSFITDVANENLNF